MAAVLLSSLLFALIAGCSGDDSAAPPVQDVYVADVVQRDVPVYMEVVGQTEGSQDVEIRARVEGYLDKVAFAEGTFVHRGDLLYQIDPKPLEAALAQAKADLATSQARLDQADITVNRMRPLARQQAVSLQELDNALATQNAARAQVDAGKAAVDKAQLDLGYTTITSPIDGIVGITQVKAGNLVGSNASTLLTTVSQVDPILFRGGISEADYLRLARSIRERQAARSEAAMDVELLLADGTTYPYKGKLEAIERAVDPTTGTLMVQVTFPNPDRLLRPGQYGRLRFVSEIRRGALLVLQRAVQELQGQYSVAVVGADNKVQLRRVTVGPRQGDLWVITEGLKPGEHVVVEGVQRVRDGIAVNPVPMSREASTGNSSPDQTDKAG